MLYMSAEQTQLSESVPLFSGDSGKPNEKRSMTRIFNRKDTHPGFNAGYALGLHAHGFIGGCPGWRRTITLSPGEKHSSVSSECGLPWSSLLTALPQGVARSVMRNDMTAGRYSGTASILPLMVDCCQLVSPTVLVLLAPSCGPVGSVCLTCHQQIGLLQLASTATARIGSSNFQSSTLA